MDIHRYGNPQKPVILLIPNACMNWEMVEEVAIRLSCTHYVLIPVLPGSDADAQDRAFPGVRPIAKELSNDILNMGIERLRGIYGAGLGGALAVAMLAEGRLKINKMVLDGAIFPRNFPWAGRMFFVLRDFFTAMLLRDVPNALDKFYPQGRYGEVGLTWFSRNLHRMKVSNIWRTFYGMHQWQMPSWRMGHGVPILYWYGEEEAGPRQYDIQQAKELFPSLALNEIPDTQHNEYLVGKPEDVFRDLYLYFTP